MRKNRVSLREGTTELKDYEVTKPIAGKLVGEIIPLLSSKKECVPVEPHWMKYLRLGYIILKELKELKKSSKKNVKQTELEDK